MAAISRNLTRPWRIVRKFNPVALVVSLGLDIAKADPTGSWSLTPEGLFEVGRRIGGSQVSHPPRAGGWLQHPLLGPERVADADRGLRGGVGSSREAPLRTSYSASLTRANMNPSYPLEPTVWMAVQPTFGSSASIRARRRTP